VTFKQNSTVFEFTFNALLHEKQDIRVVNLKVTVNQKDTEDPYIAYHMFIKVDDFSNVDALRNEVKTYEQFKEEEARKEESRRKKSEEFKAMTPYAQKRMKKADPKSHQS